MYYDDEDDNDMPPSEDEDTGIDPGDESYVDVRIGEGDSLDDSDL